MPLVFNEPTMSCCGLPTGQCRCKETTQTELRKRIHDIVQERARQIVAKRPNAQEDSLKYNVIPMETIDWEAEQKVRLQSYLGKGSLPADAKVEVEEPAPMFAPRHFEDALQAAEPVSMAPPTYYDSQGTLTTNFPPVDKSDILPTTADLAAAEEPSGDLPELIYQRGCGPGEANLGTPNIDWAAVTSNRLRRRRGHKAEPLPDVLAEQSLKDDIITIPTIDWAAEARARRRK